MVHPLSFKKLTGGRDLLMCPHCGSETVRRRTQVGGWSCDAGGCHKKFVSPAIVRIVRPGDKTPPPFDGRVTNRIHRSRQGVPG